MDLGYHEPTVGREFDLQFGSLSKELFVYSSTPHIRKLRLRKVRIKMALRIMGHIWRALEVKNVCRSGAGVSVGSKTTRLRCYKGLKYVAHMVQGSPSGGVGGMLGIRAEPA